MGLRHAWGQHLKSCPLPVACPKLTHGWLPGSRVAGWVEDTRHGCDQGRGRVRERKRRVMESGWAGWECGNQPGRSGIGVGALRQAPGRGSLLLSPPPKACRGLSAGVLSLDLQLLSLLHQNSFVKPQFDAVPGAI